MICINCGEEGPHFVPPSLGEPGFFHCKRADFVKGRKENEEPVELHTTRIDGAFVTNKRILEEEKKKALPYPWCHFPEKCSISGRCEKQFLKDGYNCGE